MGNNVLFPNTYLCGMSVIKKKKKSNSLILYEVFPGWGDSYLRIDVLPLPGTTESPQLKLLALALAQARGAPRADTRLRFPGLADPWVCDQPLCFSPQPLHSLDSACSAVSCLAFQGSGGLPAGCFHHLALHASLLSRCHCLAC